MRSDEAKFDLQDPMSVIAYGRNRELDFCNALERIADQLGGSLDCHLCSFALSSLHDELPLYHRDEEVLFDLLMERRPEDRIQARCVELAVLQHATIESYAFELAEPLGDLSTNAALSNIEALGYALRCCFGVTRQHLRWEDAVILGGSEYAIQERGKDVFQAGLVRNRRNLPDGDLRVAE